MQERLKQLASEILYTGFNDKYNNKIHFGDTVRIWFEYELSHEGGYWWKAKVDFINGCTVLKEIGFDYSESDFPEDFTFLYQEAANCEIIEKSNLIKL